CFFFQAEDGIRDKLVTGVQTCALPISILQPSEVLPVPAREEAQQREHEDHDQDDPEDAHAVKPPFVRGRLVVRSSPGGERKTTEIGRASCREREEIEVGDECVKEKSIK